MHVKIYKPEKSAMQSGRAHMEGWILECETPTAGNPESLMGWTSSGDTLNQIALKFRNLSEAVAHAEKEGWVYTILASSQRKLKPRNYADNFVYFSADEDA